MKRHRLVVEESKLIGNSMVVMKSKDTEVWVPICEYDEFPDISGLKITENHLYIIKVKKQNRFGILGCSEIMKIKEE